MPSLQEIQVNQVYSIGNCTCAKARKFMISTKSGMISENFEIRELKLTGLTNHADCERSDCGNEEFAALKGNKCSLH